MIGIERMTAGALRDAGLEEGRLALLVRDTLKGRQRSRRALERAMGCSLDFVSRDGRTCPAEHVSGGREWCINGTLTGPIRLGNGMWWEDDTLHGQLPDTMRNAILGRRLGDVLGHPHADAEAIIRAPRKNGLLSIDRHPEPLATPTVRERLTHPVYRLRLLIEEGKMSEPLPSRVHKAAIAYAVFIVAVATFVILQGLGTPFRIINGSLLCAVASYGVFNVFNVRRKRPFSFLTSLTANAKHERMEEKAMERRTGR